MDVSADLTELGRTPITVVCAGVKSILDIPRTLEVRSHSLQTQTDQGLVFLTPVFRHCDSDFDT
jgi:Indigoidine synthase A like protein